MKRSILALLTIAFVLSSFACAKKEEQKTTPGNPITETTTESTTTTEKPTETTEDTTTETTTEAITPAPSIPVEIPEAAFGDIPEVSHDLKALKLTNNPVEHHYCQSSGQSEYNHFYIEVDSDCYALDGEAYPEMAEVLNKYFSEQTSGCEESYAHFLSEMEDVDAHDDENSMRESREVTITRADSIALSFYTVTDASLPMSGGSQVTEYFNYDVKTATPIDLYDIVTDEKVFADVVKYKAIEQFSAPPEVSYQDEQLTLFLDAADKIANKEKFDFSLSSNCLTLCAPDPNPGSSWIYTMTISVIDLGGCIDLSYFDSTPSSYTLIADEGGEIKWDFDGDGVLDVLKVEDDSGEGLSIALNGTKFDQNEVEKYIYNTWLSTSFMTHTSNGDFLYVVMSDEFAADDTLVYQLIDGQLKAMGRTGMFKFLPYDPDYCFLIERVDVVGSGGMYIPCSIATKDGLPIITDSYYKASNSTCNAGIAKIDLKAKSDGGAFTVAAGTSLKLLGIDPEKKLAYFTTLNQDESLNQTFQLDLYVYSDEYVTFYAAEVDGVTGSDELFTGLFTAG